MKIDFLRIWLYVLPLLLSAPVSQAEEIPNAKRGYELLRTKAYLPADLDQKVFNQLWSAWSADEKQPLVKVKAEDRQHLILQHYGLTSAPEDDHTKGVSPALGYVVDEQAQWHMNCFLCHGGEVEGVSYPGAPNTEVDLQSFAEDILKVKLWQFKPPGSLDSASLTMSLGGTRGTTNAVIFGVSLKRFWDENMNLTEPKEFGRLIDHDMDAPPWWHYKKKTRLYCDGFAPKYHRLLMQFAMVPSTDAETFKSWEDDFRHIQAYLESIQAPAYPYLVDQKLAAQGRKVFEQNCAECHGTYGKQSTYPERMIPIDEIGTDRVRWEVLTPKDREWTKKGWMSLNGKLEVLTKPEGYVAPPLDGIWASAPYFHNGSVPTLWDVLHPKQRPVLWKRTAKRIDQQKVGFPVERLEQLPTQIDSVSQKRRYFDTRKFGKSAEGHWYPDQLTEPEKQAVLEYLKTL